MAQGDNNNSLCYAILIALTLAIIALCACSLSSDKSSNKSSNKSTLVSNRGDVITGIGKNRSVARQPYNNVFGPVPYQPGYLQKKKPGYLQTLSSDRSKMTPTYAHDLGEMDTDYDVRSGQNYVLNKHQSHRVNYPAYGGGLGSRVKDPRYLVSDPVMSGDNNYASGTYSGGDFMGPFTLSNANFSIWNSSDVQGYENAGPDNNPEAMHTSLR